MSRREYEGVLGEVMALESAAMERRRKGDPWGFLEISAPEVTYFDTGTPQRLNGREALRAEYAQREGKIFYLVVHQGGAVVRIALLMPEGNRQEKVHPSEQLRSRFVQVEFVFHDKRGYPFSRR